ncbi:unnamed protein product [Closterium sp. NIES-65]|nr:unnamed protein product [Closterium sp. NIES-65]
MLEEERGNNGDGGNKNSRNDEAAISDRISGNDAGSGTPITTELAGSGSQTATINTQPDVITVTHEDTDTGSVSTGDGKQPVELPRADNAGVTVAGGVEREGSEEQGADELGQESEMESKDEEEVGSRREASERAAEAEAEAGGRRGAEAEPEEEETGARDGSGEVDGTSGGQGEGQGRVNGALAQLRGGASGRGEGGGVEGASAEGMTCRAWLEQQDEVGVGREFEKQPVRVRVWGGEAVGLRCAVKRWDCDVPCEFVSSGDDVDASLTYAVAGKMVLRSMEARSYYPANDPAVSRGSYSMVLRSMEARSYFPANDPAVSRGSHSVSGREGACCVQDGAAVLLSGADDSALSLGRASAVQYGSWEEYDIMRPIRAIPSPLLPLVLLSLVSLFSSLPMATTGGDDSALRLTRASAQQVVMTVHYDSHVPVVMTVHYDSDVPVQYGSWEEYDIMRPPVPKTADAIAAAFISNCAANNFRLKVGKGEGVSTQGGERGCRLKAVEELQKFFPVHSYGRCLNNRPFEHDKLAVIQRYKFSLAFENSCEPDYITEKFWQSLVAGSVPVIVGPPNIADFVPDNTSYLYIQSEEDVPRVARQMQAIAADEDAYNKMLEWKRSGPSDQFIANVDLSAVHSSCRLCVLLADRIRTQEIAASRKPRPCRRLKSLSPFTSPSFPATVPASSRTSLARGPRLLCLTPVSAPCCFASFTHMQQV